MHSLKKLQLIFAVAAAFMMLSSVIYAAPVVVQQQNPYIYVKLGVSGDCKELGVDDNSAGRWAVGTVLGNPDSDQDDNLQLISFGDLTNGGPCGYYGYTTVRIDDQNLVFGESDDAGWSRAPYVTTTGWKITGTWTHESQVSVTLNLSIIRDVARFEYIIRNNSLESHSVGLRLLGDTVVDATSGNPASGNTVAYPFIPGRGILNRETDLVGSEVPQWFDFYNDPINPAVATRNILREQDATRPDRVAIGDFVNLRADHWAYAPIPDKAVTNWAWAAWWNPTVLSPGQERRIVAYYGVSAANESWTSGSTNRLDPFCVSLQGPVALKFRNGEIDYGRSDGQPFFEVKGYVYNLYHDVTLTGVTADLNLPPGLELFDGQRTQNVNMGPGTKPGEILPEKESAPIIWRVKVTGSVSGPLTSLMSVTGTGGLVKQVSHTIIIPATMSVDVISDWQLMTLPFEFKDPIPVRALGFEPEVQQYDMTYWNQSVSGYDAVTVLRPGQGFWFRITSPEDLDSAKLILAGDAKALDGATSYLIDLNPGWNMFGNPFVYPVSWGRVNVLYGTQSVPLQTAVERGWVRGIIYWWDPGKQDYSFTADRSHQLMPFRGYWIKALVNCQLMIPRVEQIGGDIIVDSTTTTLPFAVTRSIEPASKPGTKDNWRLKVVARAGSAVDTASLVGVDTRSADGYDSADVERPPALEKYVTISFPHRDWGINSGSFMRDIRRSVGTQQVWDMEVTTDLQNTDVVLTWPDLMTVPKDVVLKLVDVEANVIKHLRTTSSYRYNSGSATTRKFQIVAENAASGRLLISGLNVGQSRATGSATISYALSTDATADVRVKTLSGKTLRNLAVGRGVTRGITSLSWNYRTETGDPVPSGSYIVEIVATTPEGEVAKAVRPFMVAR